MSAILPFTRIDSDSLLTRYFTSYQLAWIHAEDPFHAAKKRVFALAEKSVRIGWTFADGFKNVRKRLRFPQRDYLFVTRDWPSALEYMNNVYDFADMLGYTRAVLSHGEDILKVKAIDPHGAPTSLTEEVKIGYIKFDNGSRIIAFSSNPYAMAVYGGDVGLDEFAKHPNAKLLWETAQGRVTLGHDLAMWSAHDGEDTLFNQFVRQARSTLLAPERSEVPMNIGIQNQFVQQARDSAKLNPELPGRPRPASELSYQQSAISNFSSSFQNSLSAAPGGEDQGEVESNPAQIRVNLCPSVVTEPVPVSTERSPILRSCDGRSRPASELSYQQSAISNFSSPLQNSTTPSLSVSEHCTLNTKPSPAPPSGTDKPIHLSTYQPSTPSSPWNLYFRITMPDALELGLLNIVKRTRDVDFTPDSFLSDCRARAGAEEIFQQSYMCNPVGAASATIVEWSAIERCRYDYEIKRVHLENDDIKKQFGEFNPHTEQSRYEEITDYIDQQFKPLFQNKSIRDPRTDAKRYRLGFDVAASGQGDLAAIYIDEDIGGDLWLAGLFTARTEDWHFLNTVLFHFLLKLKNVRAAGDESGLGRQICWEAASKWSYKFKKVNFTSRKHDLGFALMNQLSVAEKRFPRSHQDIASDFFALRKMHNGTRWNFSEGKNLLNPVSHCDIAWAGALSTIAHLENQHTLTVTVG